MHDPVFHFRQFRVRQDRCAMKVGTDGVLLGAWAGNFPAVNILDIGTGTGLIALMMAQRHESQIDAVEVDSEACDQAVKNFAASPWAGRLQVFHTSIQEFSCGCNKKYNLIVSNPPFYNNAHTAPSKARSIARHTNTRLPFDELADGVARLLGPNGRFCLILPAREGDIFIRLCASRRLHVHRLTHVKSKKGRHDKRLLIEFGYKKQFVVEEELVMRDAHSSFTQEYIDLTRDYYLGLKVPVMK